MGISFPAEWPPEAIVGRRLSMHGIADALSGGRRYPEDGERRIGDTNVCCGAVFKTADFTVEHDLRFLDDVNCLRVCASNKLIHRREGRRCISGLAMID